MSVETQYAIVKHRDNVYALSRDSYCVHAKLIDGPAYLAILHNTNISHEERLNSLCWEYVFDYKHSNLVFLAFPAMAADWK